MDIYYLSNIIKEIPIIKKFFPKKMYQIHQKRDYTDILQGNMTFKACEKKFIIDKNTDIDISGIISNMEEIELTKYQKQTIRIMKDKEDFFNDSFSMAEEDKKIIRFHTNTGIIANNVGSGKTYCVLNLISNKPKVIPYEETKWVYYKEIIYNEKQILPREISDLIGDYCGEEAEYQEMFTLNYSNYRTTKQTSCNLIIVPHNIFKQWDGDIKKCKNIKYFSINNIRDIRKLRKEIDTNNLNLDDIDILLVNNNKRDELFELFRNSFRYNIKWNRVILDEPNDLRSNTFENLFEMFFMVNKISKTQ